MGACGVNDLLVLIMVMILGCACAKSNQNAVVSSGLPNGTTLPTMIGDNVLRLTVDGDQCLSSPSTAASSVVPPNAPCVSVTVCPPGTSSSSASQCQVIPGLLVDTGSVGLRVFKSVMNHSLLSQLVSVAAPAGGIVAECVGYADGSADWGPIAEATVFLGGEPGVNTQIQLIDSTYGTASVCGGNLDQDPSHLGYNGILGVGLFPQDCGTACESTNSTLNPGMYFSCSGTLSTATNCNTTPISLAASHQVQNVIAHLPVDPNTGTQDNNGVVLMLPSVSASGAPEVDGYLILGVATRSNNTPASNVVAYPPDPSTGNITAMLNGVVNEAFIDSGSSFYNFAAGSSTGNLADCGNYNSAYLRAGYYCPLNNANAVQSISLPISGYNGSQTSLISLLMGNPLDLIGVNGNFVFADIATGSSLSGMASNTVDLGLPFYLGRNVYHGYAFKSSSLGYGPYWAF